MKTRFQIKQVPGVSRHISRTNAMTIYKKLKEMRVASADFLRATKRTEHMNREMFEYLPAKMRDLKREYHETLSASVPRLFVYRVGRANETANERMPLMGTTQQTRVLILRRLREKVKSTRRNNRDFYDPLRGKASGSILRRYQTTILQKDKKPYDGEEYVGIEIECVMPHNANMGTLLPFAKWVNVGTDGSIRCDNDNREEGKEIRVCVKRSEVRAVVPGIMDALNSMGAKVNKSCGLHVHLDQRNNLEPEKTFQKLVRSLGLLYTVVPKSRRENTYCKRNLRTAFSTNDRYKAINSLAFQRYRTLEIRLFGGTLNAEKVINWIETLEAISHGEMVNRCPKNFDTARKYWPLLTDENIAWLKARQIQFAPALLTAPTSESDTDTTTAAGKDFAARHDDDGNDTSEESDECGDCGEHVNECTC